MGRGFEGRLGTGSAGEGASASSRFAAGAESASRKGSAAPPSRCRLRTLHGPLSTSVGPLWGSWLRWAVREQKARRGGPQAVPGASGSRHGQLSAGSSQPPSSAPLSAPFPEAVEGFVQSSCYLMQWQEPSVVIALSITAHAAGAGESGAVLLLRVWDHCSAAWPHQALWHRPGAAGREGQSLLPRDEPALATTSSST